MTPPPQEGPAPPPTPWLQVAALNAAFWLLALSVTLGFSLAGVVYVTGFSLIVRDRRRTLWLVRRAIAYYGAAILKCGWPLVRVRYVDHAPDQRPPWVIVANHRASSDAFLLACLPGEMVQVVNRWPFRIPWLGFMARRAGYLSVKDMTIEAYLQAGTTLLGQGVSIATFPEGTRSGARRMGPFTSSAFRLAQHAGATIAPLAIAGTQDIPRRGSLLLRPGVIEVHKLPAVTPEEYRGLSSFKLKQLVHDRIQRHLDRIEGVGRPARSAAN